jgi:hypothetical protein
MCSTRTAFAQILDTLARKNNFLGTNTLAYFARQKCLCRECFFLIFPERPTRVEHLTVTLFMRSLLALPTILD